MKKVIAIILTVILIAGAIPVYAVEVYSSVTQSIPSTEIIIANYSTNPSKIYIDQPFKLTLTLETSIENPNDNITDLFITVNQSDSFAPVNSGSKIRVQNQWSASDKGKYIVTQDINLLYKDGESSSLSLTITANVKVDDNILPFTNTDYVSLNVVPPTPQPSEDPDTSKYAPELSVLNTTIPKATPGKVFNLSLTIANYSHNYARDITITPVFQEGSPFEFTTINPSVYLGNIEGSQSKDVSFSFGVAKNATPGTYPLLLKYRFSNLYGDKYNTEETIYIKIEGTTPADNTENPELQIQNLTVSNKAYQIDENIPIRFNLVNTGSSKLYGVEVSMLADDVILPRTQAKQSLGVMEPGKSKSLEFVFFAKKEAITRNYPIGIEVKYKTKPDGEVTTMLQYVGVYVENKEKEGDDTGSKSVPKIIIDSYSTDPVIVRAGSNFNLKISFHNTNREKTVRNIKISFTAPSETESGSVFSPVNSSNTFYIDSIAPKNSIEMERVYYTIPDAQPKTYTIIANFEYEYDGLEGSPVTAQEQIGIPVVQQTRLETSMITMPPTAYLGQPIPLSFEFYNMGKVTLSNLMITIEGDFTSSTPNYFVGNFEPGYSDYFDTMITPNSAGQLTGAIVFSYDDAAGEHQEIRKEFTTTVEEMPAEVYNPEFPGGFPGEMPGPMPEQQPTGIMKYVRSPITWVIVGVIAVGTGTLLIVKRIKKRKEMSLDE